MVRGKGWLGVEEMVVAEWKGPGGWLGTKGKGLFITGLEQEGGKECKILGQDQNQGRDSNKTERESNSKEQ